MLILQDDLEFSPDFFIFFNQTLPLLVDDCTGLLCISAWNQQGFAHTSYNTSLLYRLEHLATAGAWLLPRTLWLQELAVHWPDMSDSAMNWLRGAKLRRGRSCLVPDVSRVFRFSQAALESWQGPWRFNEDPGARISNLAQV